MGLKELLLPDHVIAHMKASCKRDMLENLATYAAQALSLDAVAVRDALMAREQLGSTGVGDGVALPHGKVAGLDGLVGFLARLDEPVDFDSVDDQPVDLVFLLLAPSEQSAGHLKALAKVSRLLRDNKVRMALRGADNAEDIFAIVNRSAAPSNAA